MRLPWPAVAGGVVVAALGATGLVRGAMPQSQGTGGAASTPGAPIVISGAYVRAPVPPTNNAAAYFTVYNTTGTPDRLLSVESGAGADTVLHTMTPDGRMAVSANGVVVPAHGRLTLATGRGHVMIEQLTGPLKRGEQVTLELDFANAGSIDISAPVLEIGDPAPTPSGVPS